MSTPAGRYRKIPVEVHAARWWKVGDHPHDDPGTTMIVRAYHHPEVPGSRVCHHCIRTMDEHGFIDTDIIGFVVCPGDWVITDDDGDHYPVTHAHFSDNYEPHPETTAVVPS